MVADKPVEREGKLAARQGERRAAARRADRLAAPENRVWGITPEDGTPTMLPGGGSRIRLEIKTGLNSFSSRQ